MQDTRGTHCNRVRAYQNTAQKEKPGIALTRRQSTRAEYKTHTKSKHAVQTTKPTPELDLQKQFHKEGRKKQNARNKRFTDNGNS